MERQRAHWFCMRAAIQGEAKRLVGHLRTAGARMVTSSSNGRPQSGMEPIISLGRSCRTLFFLIFLSASAHGALHWGIGGGVGFVGLSGDIAISTRYDVNLRVRRFLAHVRVVDIEPRADSRAGQLIEAGPLAGAAFGDSWLRCSLSGGLSFVYCVDLGPATPVIVNGVEELEHNSMKTHRTIGVPLEIELLFMPAKQLGLGMQVISNINAYSPYVGLAASIQVGRLR